MRTRRHPLSGALYDVDPDGLVHVTLDGVEGVFRPDGSWVRGELTHADPELCQWLAGPQLPPSLALLPKDLPTSTTKDG
jgi:hypothetical protein